MATRRRTTQDPEEYRESVEMRAVTLSKLFSLWFKPENIDNLATKKRLAPRYIQFLKDVWGILEALYPGRGGFNFKLVPRFTTITNTYGSNHATEFLKFEKFEIQEIHIMLHFPELEITNSRKDTITITDLFTRIVATPNSGSRGVLKFNRVLEGARASVNAVEYSYNYRHSHLHSLEFKNQSDIPFAGFCMGDSDIIAALALLNENYDIDMLAMILAQVETFVKWESLQGGPYIKMASIVNKNKKYADLDIDSLRSAYHGIRNVLKRKTAKLSVDWRLVNDKLTIVDNAKLEQNIKEIFLAHYGTSILNNSDFYIFKDEQGEYFSEAANAITEEKTFDYWIPFRNQKVYFNVKGVLKKSNPNSEKFLNPKIKNYVKSRLEYQANYAKIRQDRINQHSEAVHT